MGAENSNLTAIREGDILFIGLDPGSSMADREATQERIHDEIASAFGVNVKVVALLGVSGLFQVLCKGAPK